MEEAGLSCAARVYQGDGREGGEVAQSAGYVADISQKSACAPPHAKVGAGLY